MTSARLDVASPPARFLLSIEQELMTVVPACRGDPLRVLLTKMAELAPSLRDFGCGFFNAYGRVYVDLNSHLELAALECHDPYVLADLVDRQQQLLARAADAAPAAQRVRLWANNHDGLLHAGAATWGAHENYLVARHPSTWAAEVLPFLATRVYGGAGGVCWPSGDYVAGVRPMFMVHDVGGDTTSERAIHSTSRQEHHAGGSKDCFRYHLLLGDSHRAQFNLALHVGATALVLKAIESDADLPARLRALLARLRLPRAGGWVETLRACNRLAGAGEDLRVEPVVIELQGFYLEAAASWAARVGATPAWVERCLRDWRDTLRAMADADLDWLGQRLDAFAKHRLLVAALRRRGEGWPRGAPDRAVFLRLLLLEHGYHDLGPDSTFAALERAGLLAHRVTPAVAPGSETERFVPEVATRARARARLLVEHAGQQGLLLDWARVQDVPGRRGRRLYDPFAEDFGPWEEVK